MKKITLAAILIAGCIISSFAQTDTTTVKKENILYKCGWSPMEGVAFPQTVTHTFVNGKMVYGNGAWDESTKGQRLVFNR